ncbi:peptidylprolyl isomerase [Amycolatopsis thermoflava]|uniref:peptidylprolyl isomerase n=1 Tax=Amycolatopsis thermoflava TaxID=84480 RepID=UPI0036669170
MPANDETGNVTSGAVGTLAEPGEDTGEVVEEPAADPDTEPRPAGAVRALAARLRAAVRLPRGRKGQAVLALVVVLVAGAGSGGYLWWSAGKLPDGVAFRIGDTMVSVDELNAEADRLRALYGLQVPTDPAQLDGFRRALAKADAVRILLDGQAREQGIVIADKTAQDVLSRYISQQAGDGADARAGFVQGLGAAGTSEQAVLDEIKHMLAVNQLFEKQTQGITVTDQQVREAFAQRQASLGTPEKRAIRNIVVRTQDEANQVLGRLTAGAAFEDVARTTSLDDQSRASGGALGLLSAAQLDEGYAKAAFAAPAGGLFGPVQTQYGWNVGQVVSVVPPVPAQFDAVQGTLRQKLVEEQAMSRWQDWLTEQIHAAAVQYADDYRPQDPDAPPPSVLNGQPTPPATGK